MLDCKSPKPKECTCKFHSIANETLKKLISSVVEKGANVKEATDLLTSLFDDAYKKYWEK